MLDQVLSIVTCLSNQLVTFLGEEGQFLGRIGQEVQLISYEFGHMKAFLEMAESRRCGQSAEDNDPQLAEWIRQVREAAHDTEDVLDEFYLLLFSPASRQHGIFQLQGTLRFVKDWWSRHQLASKLTEIKERIENISRARLHYESQRNCSDFVVRARNYKHSDNISWRRVNDDNALLVEESELVGIEEPKQHLISLLINGDASGSVSRLKVIAVLGMGGIGKTTLVKKVYDDVEVESYFQIRAWVTVSQSWDILELLRGLIRQFQAEFKESCLPMPLESMDTYQLKVVVKGFLQRARYIIVFDDVWDREFWNSVRLALPSVNNNQHGGGGGNRVVITTRIADVATDSCIGFPSVHVYEMECLNFQDSWTLFCRKTFRDESCPAHLENIVQGIVRKCEGLPLAIVAVSGLLASKDLTRVGEWELVRHRLPDEFQGAGRVNRAKRILRLSYDDLPSTLKTCLLYTSIYPEDHQIPCHHIIQLWIAERLVERIPGLSAEEVAWEYIKELANRSLIQVIELVYDGLTGLFRIHDLLREVIISESREQNMMTIVGTNYSHHQTGPRWQQQEDKVIRRLVLYNNSLDDTRDTQKHRYKYLRSLIITFASVEQPISKAVLTQLLSSKLLKVVHFGGVQLQEIPKEVFNLFCLTYLALTGTNVEVVPKSIKKLKNLEYLDLRDTKVRELSVEIFKLSKLRHILVYHRNDFLDEDLGYCGFRAPHKLGGLTELQTLDNIEIDPSVSDYDHATFFKEIGKLAQLRVLGISNLSREDGKELCTSVLEKLTNLRELFIASAMDGPLDLNHSLSASSLQSVSFLMLTCHLEKMPPWIENLQMLGRITLIRTNLTDDPIKSFQHLLHLTEISLNQAYQGESLGFRAGFFLKLKKLCIRNSAGLRWVSIEEGSMPYVKQLILRELPMIEDFPLGIEQLRQLQKLEICDLGPELMKKLEDERFQESEEYKKISHVSQVIVSFLSDEQQRKWRHLFFSRKRRASEDAASLVPDRGWLGSLAHNVARVISFFCPNCS